ncbi:serine hydrolase family protein [Cellulophaga sp. F20128]|uniref:alpha/beta hydrolase n=1 Tax=Cellulophaga sp. F20128 TaxID=2926413 RepID=UPI001FF66467|nr:serine hydrolase family protein [Cellulophaga sp. F20128]MCK0156629.1 serine hydrolase family protein [Cellulophaga sp. F20128]
MQPTEKQVTYTTTNSYSTLNTLTSETKNVWIVCHGIGYLSRFFLRYFKDLPANENYIIAPQAPSKYYLNDKYTHIGASWLTRENTRNEIDNIITYLNSVCVQENIPSKHNLIIMGYSQGVSIVSRWLAKQKIKCQQFVLYAGTIPNELTTEDFLFLKDNNTKTTVIVGENDEYLDEKRRAIEKERVTSIIGEATRFITFEGGHEVQKKIINALVE